MEFKCLSPTRDFDEIAAIWRHLCSDSEISFFLSWAWMENWLACLPKHEKPHLAVFYQDAQPQAAFFLNKRRQRRHGFVLSRGWHINSTGQPRFDNIWIEYNRILCREKFKADFEQVLAALPEPWDEIWLPGLDCEAFPGNVADLGGAYRIMVTDQSSSPLVDLEKVRQKGDYLGLLSSNTRSQIRRAMRLYEAAYGPLKLEQARHQAVAEDIFAEMMSLHEATWRQRGIKSPFATDFVQQFHRRLIEQRLAHGDIQLLRLRAGQHTIGCLYSLVLNHKIFFYQSGMCYEKDRRLKPGLVTHAQAIAHNAAAGHLRYDFLGGESRYKTSLATQTAQLKWICIQKPRLRFELENRLRAIKRKFSLGYRL